MRNRHGPQPGPPVRSEKLQWHSFALFGFLWNINKILHQGTIIVLDAEIINICKNPPELTEYVHKHWSS